MTRKRIFALIVIGIFIFMSTLDGSIVNIALPTMSREMGVSLAQVTWTVTIYLIVISAIILVFGRLGDLLGKVNIFKIGAVIFTVGSFLAGFNMGLGLPFLLFARVVQAVGASMFMATSFGLVAQIFPPALRARAMSINAMFVSVGQIAGPAVGGLILQVASWNYIFFINVPVGIIAYLIGIRTLPKEGPSGLVSDVDFTGSAQMAACIALFFLAINYGQIIGFGSPMVWGSALVAVVLFILFIRTEQRKAAHMAESAGGQDEAVQAQAEAAQDQAEAAAAPGATVSRLSRRTRHTAPLIDLGIFRSKLFSLSILTGMLNFTAAAFVGILMPFFLQEYKGLSAGMAGLVMTSYPIAMLISSPISGILSDKFDKELITFLGVSGILAAQIGYLLITPHTPVGYLLVFLPLHGLSVGFFQSPNNALIMSTVERRYYGIAGSVNSLARNIAFILGTSLATITLFTSMSLLAGKTITSYVPGQPGLFLAGFHVAFLVSGCFVLVTWVLGLLRLIDNQRAKAAGARRVQLEEVRV